MSDFYKNVRVWANQDANVKHSLLTDGSAYHSGALQCSSIVNTGTVTQNGFIQPIHVPAPQSVGTTLRIDLNAFFTNSNSHTCKIQFYLTPAQSTNLVFNLRDGNNAIYSQGTFLFQWIATGQTNNSANSSGIFMFNCFAGGQLVGELLISKTQDNKVTAGGNVHGRVLVSGGGFLPSQLFFGHYTSVWDTSGTPRFFEISTLAGNIAGRASYSFDNIP
jgi:hypothetical protein